MGETSRALSAGTGGEYVSAISYAAHGATKSTVLGNGVSETWGYNARLQADTLTVAKGGTLLGLSYGYVAGANNGNVSSQTINAGGQKSYTQSYQYDELNRLTGVSETTAGTQAGGWAAGFNYGRYGNRWVTASFPLGFATATDGGQYSDATNRMVKTYDNQALPVDAHDAAGNLTNHPYVGQMSYDGQGRIVRHVNGAVTVTYGYDAEGRRVKKEVSGVGVTMFDYDAMGHLAGERGVVSGSVCSTCFVTRDTLGSTRLLSDGAGVVKQRRDYMPFGEEIASAAGFGGRQGVVDGGVATYNASGGVRQQFTGKERDQETGVDYFGARYMASAQGRFMSPDPAGLLAAKPANPQSWNLYAYVMNNPLIYIDPNGLDCVSATNNQGGFTVNHDTNSGDCGMNGGTWVPGYVDESWVHWNQKTGQYQVGSIDGPGSDATVDYATFKAGARTSDDGKCLTGCKGYGFASANADGLESQLVGNSKSWGLDGYMQFLTGREQKLSLGSKIAYGGLAFWKNNWAGPGGMGAPGGRGDWAASVHDFNFLRSANDQITIGMYFNPAVSPQTARALIQSNNMLIRNAGGGAQAGKMGLFFGAVNAFQFYVQSWK